MSLLLLVALLSLILEDNDLLCSAVFYDLSFDLSTLDIRCADFQAVVIAQYQDLIELNFLTGFNAQLFNVQDISLLNSLLLSASFDYCVHMLPPLSSLAFSGSAPRWHTLKEPLPCGLTLLG